MMSRPAQHSPAFRAVPAQGRAQAEGDAAFARSVNAVGRVPGGLVRRLEAC